MVFVDNRGLIFYSLISLVAFLWSAFVYQEGIWSLISFIVTASVLLVSAMLLIFLLWEIRRAATKKTIELR